MRRIIRRKKSGYAFGFMLCLIGLIVLFVVLWRALPNISSSSDILSALWTLLSTEQLDLTPGFGFKLMHLTIVGAAALVLGIVVLAFSRQVFSLSGETVLLQCPYCKNHWRASRAKGWAECPHCRQFIQPQVTKRS